MEVKSYQLEVKDSIFAPPLVKEGNGLAVQYVKRPGNDGERYWYQVWLYLTGNDTVFVKRVTYHLHPTFKNAVRIVERRPDNPNCALAIWTWGVFNVQVEIEDISGRMLVLNHYLTYNDEIKNQGKNQAVRWEEVADRAAT